MTRCWLVPTSAARNFPMPHILPRTTGRRCPTRPGLKRFTNTTARRCCLPASSRQEEPVTTPRSIVIRNNHTVLGAERGSQEAADFARHVGLRYVSDQMPGIARERKGKDFQYRY